MGKYLTGMISLFLQCFSVLFGFKYLLVLDDFAFTFFCWFVIQRIYLWKIYCIITKASVLQAT